MREDRLTRSSFQPPHPESEMRYIFLTCSPSDRPTLNARFQRLPSRLRLCIISPGADTKTFLVEFPVWSKVFNVFGMGSVTVRTSGGMDFQRSLKLAGVTLLKVARSLPYTLNIW